MSFDFHAAYDELNPADDDYRFYATLPGQRVLDLGCGTGTLARLFAAAGRSVVAIDPDPEMLRVARAQDAPGVDWRLGHSDVAPTSSVDLAVMSGHVAQVFTSDPAWDAALADIHRALVPGGTLAFESRNPAARAWEGWTRADTLRTVGGVEFWHETTDVSLPLVSYDTITRDSTGAETRHPDVLAFRDLDTLRSSLERAGFSVVDVYGDWSKAPVTEDSPELIVIARRDEALTGGNSAAGVVRVGDTVRKPWLPTTDLTVGYMNALRERGVDLPEPRGRDEHGRLVLEYVPGTVAIDRLPLDDSLLRRVGALVRRIHDASADLPVPGTWPVLLPTDQPDLVCHNDLATWNLVIDGDRLVFIDWDGAGPSTRLWDLAYAAISFGGLFAGENPDLAGARLGAFIAGYGADDRLRAALPTTMVQRARAMHDLLRRSHESNEEPWASMYVDGHGALWNAAATYISQHERTWTRALR